MIEPINNMDDVFYYVSKKTGKSEDHIRHVYKNLWSTVRYYLNNPLEGTGTIMLNNFLKFEMIPGRIKFHMDKIKVKEDKTQLMQERIQFYEKLLNLLNNGKRQVKQEN